MKYNNLHYGVPRGFVIGPLLFSIYILPIHDIIGKLPYFYSVIKADNIQLYYLLSNSSNVLPDNHNYVNVHQLSDHGFYLTIFYLTLQNCTSKYPI